MKDKYIYVQNINGQALMPTDRYAKVRILLKHKLAKVINNSPFTIKLLYETGKYTQPVTLGIDSGYLNIGFSAISDTKELISGEVKLLQCMSQRLKEKSIYRKIRRSRLRYRKCKFSNRKRKERWLAPSIQHKLDSHIRFIDKLYKLLPISKVIVEVANFDIQKIKNPQIQGKEYQNGEQKDFWNLREYILHRDNYKCQNPNCKNKHEETILQVHHIGYWKCDRTNRPANLITLCNKCHNPKNHKENGFLYEWQPKIKSFKEATFMSIVRWRLVEYLKTLNIETIYTYGYITKSHRIEIGLEKTHYNDAFCIAGGTTQERINHIIYTQVRRNNRSLEKFYDAKYIDIRTGEKVSGQDLFNGRRTRNKNLNSENLHKYRGKKISKGQRRIRTQRYFYQPNDLVKYEGRIYTVKGTQNNGKYIALKEIKKVPKIELIKPYKFMKGFIL